MLGYAVKNPGFCTSEDKHCRYRCESSFTELGCSISRDIASIAMNREPSESESDIFPSLSGVFSLAGQLDKEDAVYVTMAA